MSEEDKLKVVPKPWYKKGLRFECTQCGNCCTGPPGFVWVNDEEIRQIAEYLNQPVAAVLKNFIRKAEGRNALIEKKTYPHDCIFLKDKKCSIYPIRPKQCRTFPWWVYHLKSLEHWKEAAQACEGIRDDAPIVPYEEIQKKLETQETN